MYVLSHSVLSRFTFQAEAERKIQEEKERREHEEYLKLKEMFSVEEEGQADVTSEEQTQNLLMEFVQYIKVRNFVRLWGAVADLRIG